jgi:hypothetical protein
MLCMTPGCDDTHGEGSFSDDLCKLICPSFRWEMAGRVSAALRAMHTMSSTDMAMWSALCLPRKHAQTDPAVTWTLPTLLVRPSQLSTGVRRHTVGVQPRKQNQQRRVTNGNKEWQTSAISPSLKSQLHRPRLLVLSLT